MKRILITGALGHIGSSFIHRIAPGDYDEVVLLDNFATERYCSLFNLPDGVPFRIVEADICEADLPPLFEGIDQVVHLAALTNAAGSFDIQAQVENVNFDGARRVAEACARTGARMLFVSTTSVYGTSADTVDEECTPAELQPQSPYAKSKLQAEQLLRVLGETTGLRYFIGRFGTICGTSPGMRFHTAINRFCLQASMGQAITVWRTAMDQVRPYLDLTDGVAAIRFVLGADLFDNRIYNVLTENATVRQIVDVIRREIHDTQVELVDTRIMNQLSYRVSNDRFTEAGFHPQGSLAHGITDTLRLLRGLAHARVGEAARLNAG